MKKLIISKEELELFSVNKVKNLEGCPSAFRYLKLKFGDKQYTLEDIKAEIKYLIENDNADWAINFMLNLLKPQYRLKFYANNLFPAIKKIEDKEVLDYIELAIVSYSSKITKKNVQLLHDNMKKFISHIESELAMPHSEAKRNTLHYELLVLESVQFFLQDSKKKFTRNLTDSLMKLAEAKVYLGFVQYPYQDNIQDVANSLMEYTEL